MERLGRSKKIEDGKKKLPTEPVIVTEVRGAGGEIQIRKTYAPGTAIPKGKEMKAIESPKRTPKEMLKRLIKGINGKH